MLSDSPLSLLSTLQPRAGGKIGLPVHAPAEGTSFGGLLSILPDEAGPAQAGETEAPVDLTPALPAIESGKILPPVLPLVPLAESDAPAAGEAITKGDGEGVSRPAATAERQPVLTTQLPLAETRRGGLRDRMPAVEAPSAPPVGHASVGRAPDSGTLQPAFEPPSGAAAGQASVGSAPDPALRQPVAPERRESRNAPAIRVSAKVEGSPQLPLAGDEPAVGQVAGQGRVSDRPVEPRARARADAPVPQPIEPAQPDPGARPANAGAVSQPPALTSPDVAAVLDRLVAAREALKPAEAAFEIYHEEFGEVSIRIEQTQRGHLSVELAASDPELKRAVAAAVHADGAATSHADSGTSRSGGQQREGLMDRGGGAGSEPRSQGEPGTRNRREPARPDSDSARPDRHSGTFA